MIVHVPMFGCGYILLSREIRAYDLLSIAVDEAYSRTLRNLLPQCAKSKMPAQGARRAPHLRAPPRAAGAHMRSLKKMRSAVRALH